MRNLLEQLYAIPAWLILGVNAALGALTFVAHGGALLLVLAGFPAPPDYVASVRSMVPITLPVAALVVAGSAVALLSPRTRAFVLAGQAAVRGLGALLLAGCAAILVVRGVPAGNFMWTPGFLSATVAYGVYLACRFILRPECPPGKVIYAPAFAALLALPIDCGVFVRVTGRIASSVAR